MSKSKVELLDEIYALCNTYVRLCDETRGLIEARGSNEDYDSLIIRRRDTHAKMMATSDVLASLVVKMGTTTDAFRRRRNLLDSMHDRVGMYNS